MIYTTLKNIRACKPCEDGWEKLLSSLGKTKADDTPLAMTEILKSNGLDDALWCLRALGPEYRKLIVGLACDFAERSLKYVPAGETRPAECIRVTRLWIEGKAPLEDVKRAEEAAMAATMATMATAAAVAAARAAMAEAAARAAAMARAAARAAMAEARASEMEWQASRFREVMYERGHEITEATSEPGLLNELAFYNALLSKHTKIIDAARIDGRKVNPMLASSVRKAWIINITQLAQQVVPDIEYNAKLNQLIIKPQRRK